MQELMDAFVKCETWYDLGEHLTWSEIQLVAEAARETGHAYDIAVGIPLGDWNRGLSAHGRYELIADCYREAARRLEQLPSTVQAVTWVAWRNDLAGVGTRGSRV
jgi:hypothetical protein